MVLKDVSFHVRAGERIGVGTLCVYVHGTALMPPQLAAQAPASQP